MSIFATTYFFHADIYYR